MKLLTFQNYWSLMKGSNPATINTELTLLIVQRNSVLELPTTRKAPWTVLCKL